MLLELAPGLRIVRRGPRHVQVGLHGDRRVLLAHTATTAHVLELLLDRDPIDEDEPGVADVVRALVDAGCVVPVEDTWQRAVRREQVGVAVLGGTRRLPELRSRLDAAGLTLVDRDADVVVALSVGEPDRSLVDPLVRTGRPHLVVRLVDAIAILGPFVHPGHTACLRCLDAHAVTADPDHLAVLTRYVAASASPRRDLLGRPRDDLPDGAVLDLAVSWAVRDLVAHADGERPTTWSATVELGPETSRQVRRSWARHPECGCCWPGSLGSSGTMVG